jgi:RHH-type proline utilization regulon transcriptional repressor/proline dehydrogenase/delta 1-pyrroline-5-carboxylate dehydrogenase
MQRIELDQVAHEAVLLVENWLSAAAKAKSRSAAEKRLVKILQDPNGLDWTLRFVDRVIRPVDRKVAATELAELAQNMPRSLKPVDRLMISLGGFFARPFSFIVIRIAKARMRQLVGHLIADARPRPLTRHIKKARSGGIKLNLNLLGEAVLGEVEALHRFNQTLAMLKRPDVDYVSVKVSAVASQLSMWGFDATVDRLVERLLPLYEYAATAATPKFINLDMEEYRDLRLTLEVFKRLLSMPNLRALEAGIVLQAYLPDSFEALKELTDFAVERKANGGASIKVRIVKGANLAMEIVDAELHDWSLATYGTKADSDANYKRLIDFALDGKHIYALRVGIAGHNLFDLAFAHKLAERRGVSPHVEFEMLKGMAAHLSGQVKASVGSLLLYTPVVSPREFQVAIAYLTRRLEENGSPENFMSGVFDIAQNRFVFDRERTRFMHSIDLMQNLASTPNRKQDRNHDRDILPVASNAPFKNVADTDPALPANRAWANRIFAGARQLQPTLATNAELVARMGLDQHAIESLVMRSRESAAGWAANPANRKQILLNVGAELARSRGALIEVLMAEAGKTMAEADAELSEAIDFANFYAQSIDQIAEIETSEGVAFTPHKLVVVTPPWNFPVAIAAGGVLAALAAGAAAIIKPAPQVVNCGQAMVEALWRAGVPREILHIVFLNDGELGLALVGHQNVDAVILTGGFETAKLFKEHRPRMQLSAETSGKNAIVVSPYADLDLAASDIAKSAFGHAGQKCSAASLGILVGSVYKNKQFLKQLVDAASSMKVGWGHQSDATVGPIIEAPSDKLRRALTTLEKGESWLLEPKQLDSTGRLWSPGIKIGVRPGSFFHMNEAFGPVLGLMRASSVPHALTLQNATDYGLTAGLHSLNADEIKYWLGNIEAGNLYVNRGITGAIVERQPFGGLKRSTVGFGLKAGGTNYVLQFGSFARTARLPKHKSMPTQRVINFVEAQSVRIAGNELEWLTVAAGNDKFWLDNLFAPAKLDGGNLKAEGNYHRYLPATNLHVRISDDAALSHISRYIIAAIATNTNPRFSVSPGFLRRASLKNSDLKKLFAGFTFVVEAENDFNPVSRPSSRLLLVGSRESRIVELMVDPDLFVFSGEILASGRLTLLAFLREQSVSITQHRFGAVQSELVEILQAH